MRLHRFLGVLTLAAAALSSAPAFGQAWVGNQNEMAASVDYGFTTSDTIIEEGDAEFPGEKIQSHSINFALEYNPLDRLAVTASLPLVASAYKGDGMTFPRHGSYDDGDFHTTLTDLAVRARYQLPWVEETIAIAPHIGFSIPVADYETFGFANAGRHLKAAMFGISVGRTLEPILPRAFFHVRYEFALVERYKVDDGDMVVGDDPQPFDGFGQDKSDLSILLGYLVLPQLSVNLGWDAHWQHRGIGYQEIPLNVNGPLFFGHDVVLDEDFQLVGAGLSYELNDKLSLSAAARFFVTGTNTLNRTLFTVGLGWNIL